MDQIVVETINIYIYICKDMTFTQFRNIEFSSLPHFQFPVFLSLSTRLYSFRILRRHRTQPWFEVIRAFLYNNQRFHPENLDPSTLWSLASISLNLFQEKEEEKKRDYFISGFCCRCRMKNSGKIYSNMWIHIITAQENEELLRQHNTF